MGCQGSARPSPPSPPTARAIRPAVLRNFTADEAALWRYLHQERIILVKDGSRSDRTVHVFYVHGRAVAPAIAVGGKPLGPRALANQQRAAAERVAQLARRKPPPLGAVEFHGHSYSFKKLAEDFHYGPAKVLQWHGRTTWVYPAWPNPNVPHTTRAEQVLLASRGTVWIDAKDLHLVRVEMHTFRPVKYFAGILATVHHATLDLELQRIAAGVWLPRRIAFRLQATILLFKTFDEAKVETYWGYHRATTARATTAPNAARVDSAGTVSRGATLQ